MRSLPTLLLLACSWLWGCQGSAGSTDGSDGLDGVDAGIEDAGDPGPGDDGGSEPGDDGGADAADDSSGSTFEGYGSVTEGAASSPGGYDTYHVTKLDDDGTPGTLRDAVSESNRRIVFDVGGTITLDSRLKLEQDYLTLDGLSAPSPGITITHRVGEYHGLLVDGQQRHTHDVVIQGIRFRGVYDVDPVHVVGRAIFSTDGDCRSEDCTGGISKLVIDRVTLAYASDKFTLWGKVSEVTVSNSFFYGSNKAFLVSFYGEPYDLIKEKITLHHNLFAGNEERNPQLVSWITDFDFRNNIVYDWLYYGMRIKSVNVGDRGTHSVDANVVNNVFAEGTGNGTDALIYQADNIDTCTDQGQVMTDTGMGSLWVTGNQFPADNCDAYSTESQEHDVPAYARVTTHEPSELCGLITPEVGAPYRTGEENNLIDEVKTALGCQ